MNISSSFSIIKKKIIGNRDKKFDHSKAQNFEKRSSEKWLKKNFKPITEQIQLAKNEGRYWAGPGNTTVNEFFNGSVTDWEKFAASLSDKKCMEIGPGPCGALCIWWWIKTKIMIDPLILEYRDLHLKMFKETLYTDDKKMFPNNAEIRIQELVDEIDGAIICRNALDHSENPMQILQNISKYAKPGCYLLLWTDLWHLDGHDEGHRNITKDRVKFEENLKDLGFEIEHTFEDKGRHSINYGCRAMKK